MTTRSRTQVVIVGGGPSGLLLGHLQTPPTPLHSLIPDRVPPEVDAIALRCLAKNPDDRPQTVEAILDELSSISSRAEG